MPADRQDRGTARRHRYPESNYHKGDLRHRSDYGSSRDRHGNHDANSHYDKSSTYPAVKHRHAPSTHSRHSSRTFSGDDHSDEEDRQDYCKGGYHPVHVGEKFKDGQYMVVRKLGWGHFSTVWLVRDQRTSRHYAMKVVKSAKRYTETALDEIKLLERVTKADPQAEGAHFVTAIFDHFMVHGPHGDHVCMTFEVLGENLLSLIRRYKNRGLPIPLVKQISKQMLLGLDYLHRTCGIIHTDLKPENVLLYIENAEELIQHLHKITAETDMIDGDGNDGDRMEVIGDEEARSRGRSLRRKQPTHVKMMPSQPLSSGTEDRDEERGRWRRRHRPTSRSRSPSRDGRRSQGWDRRNDKKIKIKIADLGNACWVDHHFTEDIQTRQYRSPEVIIGAPWDAGADIYSLACMIFELLTGNFLFDPQKGSRFNRDDDHLAQMIELTGRMDRRFALSGSRSHRFFNRDGELRHIKRLRFWSLQDVLHEKYGFHRREAEDIASFLLPMLHYERRARAKDLINHPWLQGVDTGLDS